MDSLPGSATFKSRTDPTMQEMKPREREHGPKLCHSVEPR
jgi:hypothetical protein